MAELTTRQQEARAEILDRFAFHPATATTGPQHNEVRESFGALAAKVLEIVPAGRHQSLALTALQEAMMWSNAAIACDSPRTNEPALNPNSGPGR